MPFVAMIAGPNGSGKSTLIRHLQEQDIDLGEYINADDIAAELVGSYDDRVRIAQRMADDRRERCVKEGVDFSFETVMSHRSKLEFFNDARKKGFKALLYFVSTADPLLNVRRVEQRVNEGGHDVPRDKILSRFRRTMASFPEALHIADRALVFDNSGPDGLILGLSKAVTLIRPDVWKATYELHPDAAEWIRAAYEALPSHNSFVK